MRQWSRIPNFAKWYAMAWRTMEARYGVPTPCYWCGADATWSKSTPPDPELQAEARAIALAAGTDRAMRIGKRYRPGGGQLDHVVPVAAGGAEFDLDNIVPSCQPCNSDRGAHLGPPRRVQLAKPPPSRAW